MKLQYKDIAAYLPYNLQVLYGKKQKPWFISTVISHETVMLTSVDGKDSTTAKIADLIPVLYPMSDIVKEIRLEGYNDNKPFVPMVKIAECAAASGGGCGQSKAEVEWVSRVNQAWVYYDGRVLDYIRHEDGVFKWNVFGIEKPMDIQRIMPDLYDMLYEWHFDYRKLISQGLAVDINTLKNEP